MDFEGTKAWCTTGVGVLDFDIKMRDYLRANDFVYPVVSRLGETPEQMAMHVHDVSTLRDMILSFENPAAAVRLLASPSTKIVSLTITEFGYRVPINEGDRALVRAAIEGATDAEGPEGDARVAEAAPETRGATVFGIVLAALASRRRRGLRPFTIMSCDNLPHNGEVAKRRVLGAAADLDLCAETQRWLEEEARFPSTMVDRITPATSPGDLASLKAAAGVDDAWPVMCEPYKHWVIEDDFVDGERPAWERVGAVLVPDVRPHELMKVRLLNVGHSAMCYAGALAGCEHVHEAVTHKLIRPFLKRLMREEIAASLRADPSMEALVPGLDAYADLVLSRFKNVAVKDTLTRIAMDGSEKFRVQGRAVVMEGLAAERTVRGFALYVAAWAHFLRKSIMQDVPVRDASAALVSAPWAWARSADKNVAAADVPAEGAVGAVAPAAAAVPAARAEDAASLQAFLDIEEVFGVLAQHEGWRQAVAREFEDIAESGLEATLLGYIFGVGHNSNGDLAAADVGSGARLSERVSGTFILDEVCAPESAVPDVVDEAVAFVSLY
jgi:mannitol 2-dehydrogenase